MTVTLISQRFDSSCSFIGLDFIARSIVSMRLNGTLLDPENISGNMNPEQKAIFISRFIFHMDKLNRKEKSSLY
ncbi:hypothetical protein [Citrobacter sp. CtB7.12]|uniref:hypothetical protein n=1 Tax=Citrobacter sp. CtB7.12 TaxID=1696093 RepID=UPI00092EDABC|nr:hypothetical protein [Citrobacter sp. CtB7.12]